MPSSVEWWDKFLHRYCWEDVLALAKEYPDRKSLYVKFGDVENYEPDVANELLEHPDAVLDHAQKALAALDLIVEVDFSKAHVRITGCPVVIRRRDLRHEHTDKLIVIEGSVVRLTEVSKRILVAHFKCLRCEQITIIAQNPGRFVEPFECGNDNCGRKGPFQLQTPLSEFVDTQKIRVQELQEDMNGGEKSQTIDIDADDDLAGVVMPGNKVRVTGILRAYQRVKKSGKSSYFDYVIDAVNIELSDELKSVTLTSQDIEMLKSLASKPDIVSRLVTSFAPSISGLESEKEAVLCSAVSSGFQYRADGTPQREIIHTLLCADPGMAKSSLKFALKAIYPQLQSASGDGASRAGLTAAAVRDDFAGGAWSIEAGTLALADGAGVAIDEMDKMDKTELRKLNNALSNCVYELDKVGYHIKLSTRCFVVGFQNPVYGRFDTYEPIAKQIEISPDTLSRFDLIFALPDKVDQTRDESIGTTVVGVWTSDNTEWATTEIPVETMRKYIHFARSLKPKFADDVKEELVNQYVHARSRSQDGRVAVTTRYQEGLLRICKAEAQLCLSETITLEHFNRAVRLLEASIMQVGRDENGNLDADVIEIGVSKSQRDKIKTLVSIIKEASNGNNTAVHIQELEVLWKDVGGTPGQIESLLKILKARGDVIEYSQDRFRVV